MNEYSIADREGDVQEVQRGTSNITYLKRATEISVSPWHMQTSVFSNLGCEDSTPINIEMPYFSTEGMENCAARTLVGFGWREGHFR